MYSVMKHIKQQYPDMKNKERLIADYILGSKEKFRTSSIAKNAEAIGVSQASITNFSKKLGLKGLSQLKMELAKEETADRPEYTAALSSADTVKDTLDKALNNTVTALYNTRKTVDSSMIEKACRILADADEVMLFGIGGSRIPCEDLYLKLSRIGFRVDVPFDNHVALTKVANLKKNSAVILFSTSGRTKEIIDILNRTKEYGVTSILVTQNVNSIARNKADIVLSTSLEENNIRIGTMTARISQLYLVDVLFMQTAVQFGSDVFDKLTETHDAVQQYKVDKEK